MRSQIDWNEIVPLLAVGLQQTLYLEAVRLMSTRKTDRNEYQRQYYHKHKDRLNAQRVARYRGELGTLASKEPKQKGRKRQWTMEEKRAVVAFFKEKGRRETSKQYGVSSGMISKWQRAVGKANGAAAQPT